MKQVESLAVAVAGASQCAGSCRTDSLCRACTAVRCVCLNLKASGSWYSPASSNAALRPSAPIFWVAVKAFRLSNHTGYTYNIE